MEPLYANLCCILKVDLHCSKCKGLAWGVLSAICGAYSVTMSNEGMTEISAEVDPNICLAALARTGVHATIVWAKLNQPRPRSVDRLLRYNNNNYDHDYYSNYGYPHHHHDRYGSIDDPYWQRIRPLLNTWHQYPLRGRGAMLPEYSSCNPNYYYCY